MNCCYKKNITPVNITPVSIHSINNKNIHKYNKLLNKKYIITNNSSLSLETLSNLNTLPASPFWEYYDYINLDCQPDQEFSDYKQRKFRIELIKKINRLPWLVYYKRKNFIKFY